MKYKFPVNSQIEVVRTFDEIVKRPFRDILNAICWHRNLSGDFSEILSKLQFKENITDIPVKTLSTLKLSHHGNMAREIILNDMASLEDFGAMPKLNLLRITS